MSKLTAEKLIEVLQEKVDTGGDFDIEVWDWDTDTVYEVTSINFEGGFININETPTAANQHKPLWAIPPQEPPELK